MNLFKLFPILISFCLGQTKVDIDSLVHSQMLLLKCKIDNDPIVWQDTREGYLRNRAIRLCNMVLDQIDRENTYSLINRYYPILDSLVSEIKRGQEFKVKKRGLKNYQFNYFYSSSLSP